MFVVQILYPLSCLSIEKFFYVHSFFSVLDSYNNHSAADDNDNNSNNYFICMVL